MESDNEEEGEVLVFRSPVRRGGAKVDSSPPVANMRTRSVNTKKRMRTASNRTTTNVKSSPQSGRNFFETTAMVIDTAAHADADGDGDGDGDDGDLSEDDLSAFPV